MTLGRVVGSVFQAEGTAKTKTKPLRWEGTYSVKKIKEPLADGSGGWTIIPDTKRLRV